MFTSKSGLTLQRSELALQQLLFTDWFSLIAFIYLFAAHPAFLFFRLFVFPAVSMFLSCRNVYATMHFKQVRDICLKCISISAVLKCIVFQRVWRICSCERFHFAVSILREPNSQLSAPSRSYASSLAQKHLIEFNIDRMDWRCHGYAWAAADGVFCWCCLNHQL